MSSILTNNSAMSALSTLRNINKGLGQTQDRISSGLKVQSAKDNASYFAISESMKGDSGMLKSINESLTLSKNSVATASLGADHFKNSATNFAERVAFAASDQGGLEEIEAELKNLVSEMKTYISQATFNGDDLVNAAETGRKTGATADITHGTADSAVTIHVTGKGELEHRTGYVPPNDDGTGGNTGDVIVNPEADIVDNTEARQITTGLTRKGGKFETTSITVKSVDLYGTMQKFEAIANDFAARAGDAADGEDFLKGVLGIANDAKGEAIDAATSLGLAEKTISNQQSFLTSLVDNLDSGVGAMVDANMEEEAARLQALQVQQQLASQSLSIANQAPQNILSLFR
ncbi:flagellin [Limimaricola cinnabarinus]|uniref:flagellin N-terminal helical domain-containing protein n=1 Tax=Limimaricola cinnabarinus TaxID=1125964 RepID=UPI002492D350|nr:flagellin [Limimaricola cinnabarinus]